MKSSVCLKNILAILILGCHVLFAQTLYFLPPEDDKWIAGNSYLYNGDEGSTELMQIDAARCGWFKKEFKSESAIPEKVLIYLGSQGRDKLDAKGKGADLSSAEWIPLKAQFGTPSSSELYIIANSDGLTYRTAANAPAPGSLGEDAANRCAYKMAAFIYDTDSSVNSSFRGNYAAPAQSGLRRGIVKPVLDTTDGKRKPVFAVTTVPFANWQSKESFDAAFTPKGALNNKISNIPRCYDMPFKRVLNGTWEFDSDSSRTADRQPVGGFYPYLLDPTYTLPDDGESEPASYADCPTCNKTYTANCFNTMNATALNEIPALEYKGETYTGIDALNRANDRIEDGVGNPYNVYSGNYGCDAPAAQPRPGPTGAKSSTANLSFCFESHAEFVYEKGQEFFFRGDDDIWVFINNRLVIDLGGVHQPIPGFVDLDTIKTPEVLVEGKIYPIDIFFCERMATQSNVRVSTNMYITQKSSFYNEPEKVDNWMCASIKEGNTCAAKMGMVGGSSQTNLCGNALIRKNDYTVDFYMVERNSGETISLSGTKNLKDCEGTDNEFTCFKKDGSGGIVVDSAVYSCGGRSQCKGNEEATKKVSVPDGNWVVYARLMDKSGTQQVSGTKPILIDQFKSITNARIAWGKLKYDDGREEVLKNSYGGRTSREQEVIAGKRTPIYITGGEWDDIGRYTTFIPSKFEESDIKTYSLTGTAGLKITSDNLGKEKVIFPRTIPEGKMIDTLWVEGDFYMGEKEFNINLEGVSNSEKTPDLTLTIYQPQLKFTEKFEKGDEIFTIIEPASGFERWTGSKDELPYVGKALDVYVVAWDTLRDELCDHCNFVLRETSTTNNNDINKEWGDAIVQSDAVRIENGKQIIDMRGRATVDGDNFAEWQIYGPSESLTFAKWTKLQFIDAPIPMPLKSYVYDRNGDGIGDSLVIKFSMPFKDKNGKLAKNLLPVLLEANWEKDYPVYFHAPVLTGMNYGIKDLKNRKYVMTNLYNEKFFEANFKYWEDKLVDDTTIVIAYDTTTFSKDILTAGKGSLLGYTPFYDPSKCKQTCDTKDTAAFVYRENGYEAAMYDRIPPIVKRAVYNMDSRTKDCGTKEPCRELLEVVLSEPVFGANASVVDSLFENPFSYCFEYSQRDKSPPKIKCSEGKPVERKNQKWNNLKWTWELPGQYSPEDVAYSSTYKPNNKPFPKTYDSLANLNGDDIVNLNYRSKTETRMPKATDWIKIRSDVAVFRDAEGNSANPREIGQLISGTNYYKKEQVKIAVVIADPDSAVLGGIFTTNKSHPWLSNTAKTYAKDNLFKSDTKYNDVAEFLPVPKGISNPDTIRKYYPASVGTLFDVSTQISDKVRDILDSCSGGNCQIKGVNGEYKKLTAANIAEGINIRASAYYHTNLGNYTAHRNPVWANCTDKIFQKDSPPSDRSNDCWGNEFNFYLAWDLRTNKNRFVGVGAYVAITKFYWQIEYKDAKGVEKTEKSKQDEFIEMFGVRRSKYEER